MKHRVTLVIASDTPEPVQELCRFLEAQGSTEDMIVNVKECIEVSKEE